MAGFYEFTPLSDTVITEFTLREQNRGLNSPVADPYKGPLSTWVRVCSNGEAFGKSGFIMFGGTNFDDTYGFGIHDRTILGKTADGDFHFLQTDETFTHRPPPGVVSIDSELSGDTPGKFMITKINWRCWSPDHLEYMEKFFGIPGLSIIVEFGWNNIPDAPLDLTNIDRLVELWANDPGTNGKNTPMKSEVDGSSGRREVLMGFIKNYTFTLNELGGYDCVTEIISYGDLAECLKNRNHVEETDGKKKDTIKHWVEKNLARLKEGKAIEGCPGSDQWGNSVFSFEKLKDNHDGRTAKFEVFDGNGSKFYIRMDLVIKLVQKFYNDIQKDTGLILTDCDNVYIVAHPNLKSTKSSLIITNENAPVGFYDNVLIDDQVIGKESNNEGSSLSDANKALQISQQSNDRVNLKKIVKDGMVGKNAKVNSFPIYGDPDQGYSGKLIDLFVDSDVVKKCFTENEKMVDGLSYLLRTLSDAACGIWDFDLRPSATQSTRMTIIDKNYKGSRPVADIAKSKDSYTFQFGRDNSIVKSVSFSATLPNSVAMDTIGKVGSGVGTNNVYQDSVKNYSGFFTRNDRLIKSARVTDSPERNPDKKLSAQEQADAIDKEIAEVQKRSLDTGYFIVKIPSKDKKSSILVRLLETDEGYQKALLVDNNPKNNAIFNGLVPGIELKIDVLGISGLNFLDYFHITGLPNRYEEGGVFAIKKIKHSVSDSGWITTIIAGMYASSFTKE